MIDYDYGLPLKVVGVVLALPVRRGAVVAERLALAVGVGELEVEGGPVALTLQITLPGRATDLTCKITVLCLLSFLFWSIKLCSFPAG